MEYYNKNTNQILTELKTFAVGLTTVEAKIRQHHYGLNELKEKNKISPWKIFFSQFDNFVIYILFGATVISFLLKEYIDATAILAILLINAILGFVQEFKAEKAIDALKKLSALKTKVLRDARKIEIDSKDLVPGDIILIEAGDKVSCDARIIDASQFEVDESTLTGESVPVHKFSDVINGIKPLADRKNMVFSGTLCTKGTAKAICIGTGMHTEIGQIADQISTVEKTDTPLQISLDKLGKYIGYFVILICIFVFLAGVYEDTLARAFIMQGEWLKFFVEIKEIFITSVAIAVAAIPEGLAVVVTIALAIGVKMMVKRNALIRKLPSVETLGCTTVVCSDKTGTLTYNQMTVVKIFSNAKEYTISGEGYATVGEFTCNGKKINPAELDLILKAGCLNNNASLDNGKVVGDPTEGALIVSCEKAGIQEKELEIEYKRLKDLPFEEDRKMMSTMHKSRKGIFMFTKGAPERVLAKCTQIKIGDKISKMSPEQKKVILDKNMEFASKALRVLGFAYKPLKKESEFKEEGLIFLGLQAMIDPPRKEVKYAIEKCHSAGVRVIMITGDHVVTAEAIGKEIGLFGKAISGEDLDKINLDKEIDNISIFARVSPHHKMKIVDALQRKGNVVAMTGDGVNDAPALKKADLGIAMGIAGTDVAKEASDMILMDDNFTSIVNAIEQGRGVYDNIKRFVCYMLSCNFAEVAILFVAIFMMFNVNGNMVLPLTALQILWMNLVTDSLPALALGVDPVSKDVMERKPRKKNARIISNRVILNIVIVCTLMTVSTLLLFSWCLGKYGLAVAQTASLTLLVLEQVAVAQMVRQENNLGIMSNKWLIAALAFVILLQIILVYHISFIEAIFGVTIANPFDIAPLSLDIWAIMVGISIIVYSIVIWLTKVLNRFFVE